MFSNRLTNITSFICQWIKSTCPIFFYFTRFLCNITESNRTIVKETLYCNTIIYFVIILAIYILDESIIYILDTMLSINCNYDNSCYSKCWPSNSERNYIRSRNSIFNWILRVSIEGNASEASNVFTILFIIIFF